MNFNIIEMENKLINGEATQVEEASEKIFNTLRDWSESEYQEEMTFLGIDVFIYGNGTIKKKLLI